MTNLKQAKRGGEGKGVVLKWSLLVQKLPRLAIGGRQVETVVESVV